MIAEKPLRRNQRRRVARVPVEFPVQVTWGKKQYQCQARQLSDFGILLTPPRKELVGENIGVRFALGKPKSAFNLSGVVVYAAESGCGIRFESNNPEQLTSLHNYVHSLGIGVVRP